jgi:hypothetical protein
MVFGDIKIAVRNRGPVEPELFYGGKPYTYPMGEVTIVPYEVAYFHYAIEVKGGKLTRDKAVNNPDGSQTWYENRIASYSPYGLTHGRLEDRDPQKFKEFRSWFSDGLDFKIVKTPKIMSPNDFDKL